MTKIYRPRPHSRKRGWYDLHLNRKEAARSGRAKPGRGWSRGPWFKSWVARRKKVDIDPVIRAIVASTELYVAGLREANLAAEQRISQTGSAVEVVRAAAPVIVDASRPHRSIARDLLAMFRRALGPVRK